MDRPGPATGVISVIPGQEAALQRLRQGPGHPRCRLWYEQRPGDVAPAAWWAGRAVCVKEERSTLAGETPGGLRGLCDESTESYECPRGCTGCTSQPIPSRISFVWLWLGKEDRRGRVGSLLRALGLAGKTDLRLAEELSESSRSGSSPRLPSRGSAGAVLGDEQDHPKGTGEEASGRMRCECGMSGSAWSPWQGVQRSQQGTSRGPVSASGLELICGAVGSHGRLQTGEPQIRCAPPSPSPHRGSGTQVGMCTVRDFAANAAVWNVRTRGSSNE